MKKVIRLFLVLLLSTTLLFCLADVSQAKSRGGGSYTSNRSYTNQTSGSIYGVKRNKNGHIARNLSARKEFMKQTGYPNGRPGYVIDHIAPLKRGGADSSSNMQWQTKEEAKAKDRLE